MPRAISAKFLKDNIICVDGDFEDCDEEDLMEALSLSTPSNCGKVKIGKRSFKLDDEINGSIRDSIIYPIIQMNEEEKNLKVHEPINIYISSPGGEISHTFALIDVIQNSEIPIHIYALGQICSAATFILASGHKRYGYKNSSYMIHNGSTTLSGKYHQIISNMVEIENTNSRVIRHFEKTTLITEAMLKEIDSNELWLTSEQALEYKLIDEII